MIVRSRKRIYFKYDSAPVPNVNVLEPRIVGLNKTWIQDAESVHILTYLFQNVLSLLVMLYVLRQHHGNDRMSLGKALITARWK